MTSLRPLLALVPLWLIPACVDPPLGRINPNDSGADFTLTIIATSDTVSDSIPVVILQAITDPLTTAYPMVWSQDSFRALSPVGEGVYARIPGPLATTRIRVQMGSRSAYKDIVRKN